MEWNQLFSSVRLGQEHFKPKIVQGRTEFQKDFDRIAFSSPFKRLQNKTQAIPLPETELIRNRLTHSFETSIVGRSLGETVGEAILSRETILAGTGITKYDFGSIVAAACIAHDIGNPPFGHAGEDAISEFFQNEKNALYLDGLTVKQAADLRNYEGNAAGFRIIAHTLPGASELNGGFNLTYSTLATFAKYPKESLPVLKKTGKASEKKYGFFQSEKDSFGRIARELGLIDKSDAEGCRWNRHPLAFLVEAADDICYHLIDFEDGYEMGLIPFAIIEEKFKALIGEKFHRMNFYAKMHDPKEKVVFLRSMAFGALVAESAELFLSHERDILNGTFDEPLTKLIPSKDILKAIESATRNLIYMHTPILEVEAAGFKVVDGLMGTFMKAVTNNSSSWSRKIRSLIPLPYLIPEGQAFDMYTQALNITMYIASLSDKEALRLYRSLSGISL
jgi:dGTPase